MYKIYSCTCKIIYRIYYKVFKILGCKKYLTIVLDVSWTMNDHLKLVAIYLGIIYQQTQIILNVTASQNASENVLAEKQIGNVGTSVVVTNKNVPTSKKRYV